MIMGPKAEGDYPDRWLECQRALEPAFRDLIEAQETPFVDLASVVEPLLDAAVSAGWTAHDVSVAVAELAVNHEIGHAAQRGTNAAIARAVADRLRR